MTRFVEHHFCSDCRETFRTNKQLKMHVGHKHKETPTVSGSGE